MTYQEQLKSHLAEYKRVHLGISEPGTFRHKGRDVLHPHILPRALALKNLLPLAETAVTNFLSDNPRKRHKDFHHLNSSQAFVFNLFFPYFLPHAAGAGALLRALGQSGELISWEPEAVPDSEEQSNIDVVWTTTDGTKTFCEVKLSEAEFGTAKDDERHRSKLTKIYSPLLSEHLSPAALEAGAFFGAYQFNRNLWHMLKTEKGSLIFLLPRANGGLWKQLDRFLESLGPAIRSRVSAIAIEDVLAALSADVLCPDQLREYAKELCRKYVPGGST